MWHLGPLWRKRKTDVFEDVFDSASTYHYLQQQKRQKRGDADRKRANTILENTLRRQSYKLLQQKYRNALVPPTSPQALLGLPNKTPSAPRISIFQREDIVRLHVPRLASRHGESFPTNTGARKGSLEAGVSPDTAYSPSDTGVMAVAPTTGSVKDTSSPDILIARCSTASNETSPTDGVAIIEASTHQTSTDITSADRTDKDAASPKGKIRGPHVLPPPLSFTDEDHHTRIVATLGAAPGSEAQPSQTRYVFPLEHTPGPSLTAFKTKTLVEQAKEIDVYDAINKCGIPKDLTQLETMMKMLATSVNGEPCSTLRSFNSEVDFDLPEMQDEYSLPVHGPNKILRQQDALLAQLNFMSSIAAPGLDAYSSQLEQNSRAAVQVFNRSIPQSLKSTTVRLPKSSPPSESALERRIVELEGEKEALRKQKEQLEIENLWLRGMHDTNVLGESRVRRVRTKSRRNLGI